MHPIDLGIFIVYVVVMLGVGFFFYRKNEGAEDYYVGGRNIGSFHIGLSVVATDVGGGFSIGLGTNLNCLHGIMPSKDKLIQLSLYKQIIELKFSCKIPWVSGGTSVAIPLIFRKQLPMGVNHFRVGEALYFGLDLFSGNTFEGMESGIFELRAEVIEVTEKQAVPIGVRGEDPSGEVFKVDPAKYGLESTRAIVDIGLLDIDPKFLVPRNKQIKIAGGSSDMLVLDLGENPEAVKVGDQISFHMRYRGVLQLMNSYYIKKVVV